MKTKIKTTKTTSEHALTAAKWIGRGAYAIAAVGTVASYGTQVALLLAHEVGAFSYAIPATIDVLAICAAMALQLPGLDRASRQIAGAILFTAVAVSVAANLTGGHNGIARAAHAWPVLAYLLGELLANRVRTYAHRLQAAAAPATPVQATATVGTPQTVATVNVPATVARTIGNIANVLPAPRPIPVVVPATARQLPIAPLAPMAITVPRPPRQRVAAASAAPRATVSASVADSMINPKTNKPYSRRHASRLRTGR